MRDPKTHAENRGGFEDLLRRIPGFRGYLEKEYRRDSDALQRKYLADRIDRAKRSLDQYTRALVDRGRIDETPAIERLRSKLERQAAQIRAAMQGYSGVFDLVKVDEAVLERVYECDAALASRVEVLANQIEQIGNSSAEAAAALPPVNEQLAAVERAWQEREQILMGLA